MWRVLIAGVFVLTVSSVGTVMAQGTPEATKAPPPASPALTGVTWQWEHFSDGARDMDIPAPSYTITFRDHGQFRAQADCNTVLGFYTASAGKISMVPGPTTLAACPPGSLGDEFVRDLGRVGAYSFKDGKLLLEIPADSGTLTFVAQPQVTGRVTYRAQEALPHDAVLKVQVQDVSIADAPAPVIGEQAIQVGGAQEPIPFAVAYPASAVQPERRYSVLARISDRAGKLLFITDTVKPVITGGNPTSGIQLALKPVSP